MYLVFMSLSFSVVTGMLQRKVQQQLQAQQSKWRMNDYDNVSSAFYRSSMRHYLLFKSSSDSSTPGVRPFSETLFWTLEKRCWTITTCHQISLSFYKHQTEQRAVQKLLLTRYNLIRNKQKIHDLRKMRN